MPVRRWMTSAAAAIPNWQNSSSPCGRRLKICARPCWPVTAPPLQEHAAKLAEFQQALFNDVRETFESLQAQNDTAPLRVDDLPAALRDQFIGVTGKFLLQVYPKHDVWQRGNQEKFVADLRTVDPNATGTPVQLYEYETLLKNSYVQAAWYSLAAIVVLVFFHFRSLGAVILSLLPVASARFG